MQGEVYDFHTHTLLSDGQLSPLEIIRRAVVKGYKAIAITDHMGLTSLHLLPRLVEECALAQNYWDILPIPGVELTHIPPPFIPEAARRAKELGAWLVVVHGESIIEPVEKGTNKAALSCPHVDILAHPGLFTFEEASLAAKNGIFLELTARKGHCLTNGYTLNLARQSGASLLICSDAHQEEELLTPEMVLNIAKGSGMDGKEIIGLGDNIQKLLKRLPPKPRS